MSLTVNVGLAPLHDAEKSIACAQADGSLAGLD